MTGEAERGAAARLRPGALAASQCFAVLFDEGTFEQTAHAAAAGVVAGRGAVNGRAVHAYAVAGPLGAAEASVIAAVQDRAVAAGAPLVAITHGAGARLDDGLAALAGHGAILRGHARAAGRVPQLALALGACAGAGALLPALADFVFMVEGAGAMAVTGAAIVQAVANEAVTEAALGGAAVHAAAGNCDAVYANAVEALLQMRRLIDFLPAHAGAGSVEWPAFDAADRAEPALDSLVPDDPHTPYDMMELIEKLLDGGDFLALQPAFGRAIVTGFGAIAGRGVGIVASQPLHNAGVLDAAAAGKAARFMRFCAAFDVPVVTLADTPGFLPDTGEARDGLARRAAALLSAYAAAACAVTVVTRNALGGAGLVLGSKAIGAGAALAWPSARIGLIGAKGAAALLAPGGDPAALEAAARDYAATVLSPAAAQAAGAIDAVIEPRATRAVVAGALSRLDRKQRARPNPAAAV